MTFRKYKYPLLLTAFSLLLLMLSVPAGYIFGSDTDWFSQHVGIADHFRKLFYDTNTLFPDYSPLGGGTNLYTLSYYGFLRPDILIACLLPMVPMKWIIIAYSITGVILSVTLCYHWLTKQGLEPFFCFIGGMLLASSTCFFHSHMQIMFVNYLPFLFLALLSIDSFLVTGRRLGLILSLFLIYLHSFYFSISCLTVCMIYVIYRTRDIKLWFRLIIAVTISISMAGILLIPTALTILEHAKDAGQTSLSQILAINVSLKSLLYSRYGCGTTLVCLYTLFLGIRKKDTRVLSAVITVCLLVNAVPYLLNGTLYIRGKVLIPFLPLIYYVCVTVLRDLAAQKLRHNYLIALLCLIPLFFQSFHILKVMDAVILFLFIFITSRQQRRGYAFILCVIPAVLFVNTGWKDLFVPQNDSRQEIFTQEELNDFYQDRNARFDSLTQPLANVNYLPVPEAKKTSVYSSTTNTAYSTFYYDIMKNPIRINNRVGLLPEANPFFEYLMGIRYLQTYSGKVPYGYQIKDRKKDSALFPEIEYILAENKNVLPTAYASFMLYGETAFHRLSFPYTLDTISNNTIVKQDITSNYSSKIKKADLSVQTGPLPQEVICEWDGNAYDLKVTKESKIRLPLRQQITSKVIILSFDVKSLNGAEVTITMNSIRNKLSGKTAPYPNHNNTFTYMLSSNDPIDALEITLSKGHYRIENTSTYTIDAKDIGNSVVPFHFEETSGKEVLTGTIQIEEDGYFATSLPYQQGYTALVDGKKKNIEVVNTAFVGFPLEEGDHQITIAFHAPGKRLGVFFSLIGLIGCLFLLRKDCFSDDAAAFSGSL